MWTWTLCVFVPGCGEHLIRTMLARECSAAMQSEDAHQALLEAMQNKFISESLPPLSTRHFFCFFFASKERVLGKNIEKIKQADAI